MEVALLASSCIPEDAILSVRAGTVRRQAGIRSGRPFRFPKIGPEENPLKIDILQQIATTYLVMKPNEDQYKVSFSGGPEAAGMTCEVQIKADAGGKLAPAEEDVAKGEDSDSAKEAKDYLESHQILQFVQALLQTVIKERPADPYAYMARHFMSGYEPLDQKAPKAAPNDEAPQTPASPMAPMLGETIPPTACVAATPVVEAIAAAVADEAAAPDEAAAAEEPAPPAEEAVAAAAAEAAPEEAAAAEQAAPAEEAAPAAEAAPAEEAAPAAEEAPAEEVAPAEESVPATQDAPAEEVAPAEEAVPAAEDAPAEGVAPAEEPAEAAAVEEQPAEE